MFRINPEKLKAVLLRKITEYSEKINKQISDLQELVQKERESGRKDPEAFKNMFSNFRHLVQNEQTRFAHLDRNTREGILEMLAIDDSKWFHFCEHISLRLDYFFRFFYLIGFLWFVAFSFSTLYDQQAIAIGLTALCLILLAAYVTLKLKYRMRIDRLTLGQSICFYLRCHCCIRSLRK